MKTCIYVFVLTTCAVGMATTPSSADPWKHESGKYWGSYKKWDKNRAKDIREWEKERRKAAKEWEKDRREAAREWEKQQREHWREGDSAYYEGSPHRYYERYGPLSPPSRYEYAPYPAPHESHYRWYRFDDDVDDDDLYDDDGYWRHGGAHRFQDRYRQPYYGDVYEPYDGYYYYNRGGEIGARIGSRIGGAIGGPEGAAIGADIGAEIGSEVDD